MTILLISLAITLLIATAWKLVSKRKHRKTGLWILFALYLGITGFYWLNNVSLWWIVPITIFGGFLGVIWSSQGFRNLLFRSGSRESMKVEAKVKEVKQGREGKPSKEDTQQKIFKELERRNIPLTEEKNLSNMTLGELLKEAERNGIHIGANNSTK